MVAKNLIGKRIYKEHDGDGIHGIVTQFFSRMNLLKVWVHCLLWLISCHVCTVLGTFFLFEIILFKFG